MPMTNVSFCDLCNESIPQADLDQGRAVRRNERLICAACEAAMSSRPMTDAGPDVGASAAHSTQHLPPAPAAEGGSSVVVVALALSALALIVAAGAAFFALVQ